MTTTTVDPTAAIADSHANTPNPPSYVVVWQRTNFFMRFPCAICGGCTAKDSVLVVFYEAGAEQTRDKQLGFICHRCVAAGPAAFAARLTEHAEGLEARAALARKDATATWTFPARPLAEFEAEVEREWEIERESEAAMAVPSEG